MVRIRLRGVCLVTLLLVIAASVFLSGRSGSSPPKQTAQQPQQQPQPQQPPQPHQPQQPQQSQQPPTTPAASGENPIPAQPRSGSVFGPPLVAATRTGDAHGWLLTGDGFRRTSSSGAEWLDVTPDGLDLNTIRDDAGRFYALSISCAWLAISTDGSGNNVTVYRTADGGRTWNAATVAYPSNAIVSDLYFVDEQHGFLLVSEGGVSMGREMVSLYSTSDGGSQWTLVSRSDPHDAVAGALPCIGAKTGIAFLDAERGWLTGLWNLDGAYFYSTKDGGRSWQKVDLTIASRSAREGGMVHTYPPLLFDDGRGLLPVVIDYNLLFYTTSDSGETWEPTEHTIGGQKSCWSFTDADHGWASNGDYVYTTTDGGRTWTSIKRDKVLGSLTGAGGFEICQLSFCSNSAGWAVLKPIESERTSFRLLATSDGGSSWTDLGEVWKSPPGEKAETGPTPPGTITELPDTLQDLGRCFAFADEQGHAAIYDLDARKVVWSDDLEVALGVDPSWSPDGSTLAYWCGAGDPETTYMAFLSPDERTRTLVHLPGLGSWDFNLGASMIWSPSSRYLSLETASYPPCPVTVLDRSNMTVVTCFSCIGGPCWSPDETRFAYSDIEGKYFGGMGLFHSFLVIRDVATGEETVVARGETDFSMNPVRWTEDGEVVYAYYKADVPTRWLDTAGREYEPPDASDTPDSEPTGSNHKPQGFPKELGRIRRAILNPETGDWLLTVSSVGEPDWLYYYREGEDPVRLVQGMNPAWRVSPATF